MHIGFAIFQTEVGFFSHVMIQGLLGLAPVYSALGRRPKALDKLFAEGFWLNVTTSFDVN
jgi:hypothetical protein